MKNKTDINSELTSNFVKKELLITKRNYFVGRTKRAAKFIQERSDWKINISIPRL